MLYAIVAVIALILDQLLKYWTTISVVVDTGQTPLIPGFIHLSNVHNYGAAFSFLQGARWFFVGLCAIFVIGVIFLLVKRKINTPVARWCAVIVCAGALGNCIDRIINGYVVDMLEFDFKIFGFSFPVFNLADIYLTLGVIAFCICVLAEKNPDGEKNAKKAGPAAAPAAASPGAKGGMILDFPQQAGAAKPQEKAASVTAMPQSAPGPAQTVYSQPAQAQKPAGTIPQPQPLPPSVPLAKESQPQAQQQYPLQAQSGQGEAEPGGRYGKGGTKTEQVMRLLVNGTAPQETPGKTQQGFPAQSAPVQAAAPESFQSAMPQNVWNAPAQQRPAAAKPANPDEPSYDLDDILAEFRDL